MTTIKRIALLNGESYRVGQEVIIETSKDTIDLIGSFSLQLGDEIFTVYRVWVSGSSNPYMDIPFHAVSRIFYS